MRPAGPGRGRGSGPSAPRTIGSCSAQRIAGPTSGQLREEVGDRRRPGRIELGGRLVEDEDRRPHRHDAGDRDPLLLAAGQGERLAVGEVADREPRRAMASIRASISSRGTPRFSSPKASSSRTVSFDADSWLAGVEKTIPTRPSSAPTAAVPRASIADGDRRPVELRPHDPRDEPGRGQRERRLAGAGPAGDADPLAGRDRQVDAGQRRLAPTDVADRHVVEDEGPGSADAEAPGPARGPARVASTVGSVTGSGPR